MAGVIISAGDAAAIIFSAEAAAAVALMLFLEDNVSATLPLPATAGRRNYRCWSLFSLPLTLSPPLTLVTAAHSVAPAHSAATATGFLRVNNSAAPLLLPQDFACYSLCRSPRRCRSLLPLPPPETLSLTPVAAAHSLSLLLTLVAVT
jgi:hypothetical protein